MTAVVDAIAGWAVATPHATAALDGPRSITYGLLLERARRVAGALRAVGAGRDEVVGLSCPRGLTGLTGMLGVLLSGSAYLYLDPAWPAPRREHMLRQCRVRLVLRADLADGGGRDGDGELAGEDGGGCVEPSGLSIVDAMAAAPRAAPRTDRADLCYVVYTSGSTGVPKGVAVEHGGVAAMAGQLSAAFELAPGIRVLQFANWSWDAAAGEILPTLSAGGTVVLAGEATRHGGELLAALMRRHRVRVATLTPSLLAALPEADLPDLRTVVAVGEPCPPEVVARWAPGRRFLNGYGPTEATVAVSVGRCRPGEPVTIGRPLPGVLVRILDAGGAPVATGEPGELVVGGTGVARGYLRDPGPGDPERVPAVARFPYHGGTRWYHTGDLVSRRPDGQLVHHGRLDDQVKVRGHRVELAEVEHGLRRHQGVRAAAVTTAGGRLVACVVAAPGVSGAQVRAEAARWLPEFMLPTEIRVVGALPLSGNGKLDRHALAAVPARPPAAAAPADRLTAEAPPDDPPARVPAGDLLAGTPAGGLLAGTPAGDLLADVLALVRRALETDAIGPQDDLFDAGGHSLVAAQLAVAATERFAVPVTALDVYDHPTPVRLAEFLGRPAGTRRAA